MEGVTVASIFTEATSVMTGLMGMTTNFFSGLWENPYGKVIIGLSLTGAAIGLCYKLFLRKKRV